jgi:hypothetical protein
MLFKSGKIRWLGDVARIKKTRKLSKILREDLQELSHSGDYFICERIIFKWVSKR